LRKIKNAAIASIGAINNDTDAPSGMSFPEIAREMFLSPNTIKSEAYSIYRKLGASSRSQAVTRSRDLGLIDR